MTPSDDPARPRLDLTLHINSKKWTDQINDVEALTHHAMEVVLRELELADLNLEASVVLADDAFVQKYNLQYRGQDKPTNVLSFPAQDDPSSLSKGDNLGDIMMAFETIERESKEQNKDLKDHYSHMVVHGLLHLLGYDHIIDQEANKMETLEIKILNQLGISNPYQETNS